MTKVHIRGGRLIDPLVGRDETTDVFIDAGRVVALGRAPQGFVAERTVEAAGLVVAPGLVDLAARLREPGFEYKATLESELAAALAGGVTSLVCPPDTEPVLDEPGLVEMLKHRAKTLDQVHVYPLGALTMGLHGAALTEMCELTEAGSIGFSQANTPIENTTVLLHALEYAQTFGYTVWLRPQDAHLGRTGTAASGAIATRLGLPGVPVMAETVALHTIFELVRATGARVHLCRLSSAPGIELVRAARAAGLPISADVAAHQIHLTDVDIGFFDPQFRLDPPLRGQRDRAAIRAALLDGTVGAICSDHTPVDEDAKQMPFGEAEPGASGLELLLSLTVKWAMDEKVELKEALGRITCGAAAIAGLDAGHLGVGARADVCVFDPAAHWLVTPASLKSQGHNTPFLGYELPARVVFTLVGGDVAYESHAGRG